MLQLRAKILAPAISRWNLSGSLLRARFLADLERRIGRTAASGLASTVEATPLQRLAEVWLHA